MMRLREKMLLKEAVELMLEGEHRLTPWSKRARRIKYRSNKAGVGPGEARLAYEMGGTIMGGSVSHDIEDELGGKWEVKEPHGTGVHGEIRTEAEGIAALEPNLNKMKNVARRIQTVFGAGAKPKAAQAARTTFDPSSFARINHFSDEDAPMILKGEVSQSRIDELYNVLVLINKQLGLSKKASKEDDTVSDKYVEIGDAESAVKKPVDLPTYVKVGKALKLDKEEMRVSSNDVLMGTFDSRAFTDPDKFYQVTLKNAVLPSMVFGHTDGVVLVRNEGYLIIPRDELDTRMVFTRISKGKPYFKLT